MRRSVFRPLKSRREGFLSDRLPVIVRKRRSYACGSRWRQEQYRRSVKASDGAALGDGLAQFVGAKAACSLVHPGSPYRPRSPSFRTRAIVDLDMGPFPARHLFDHIHFRAPVQLRQQLAVRGRLTFKLHTMMSGRGLVEKRTTELADEFVKFITSPVDE